MYFGGKFGWGRFTEGIEAVYIKMQRGAVVDWLGNGAARLTNWPGLSRPWSSTANLH